MTTISLFSLLPLPHQRLLSAFVFKSSAAVFDQSVNYHDPFSFLLSSSSSAIVIIIVIIIRVLDFEKCLISRLITTISLSFLFEASSSSSSIVIIVIVIVTRVLDFGHQRQCLNSV